MLSVYNKRSISPVSRLGRITHTTRLHYGSGPIKHADAGSPVLFDVRLAAGFTDVFGRFANKMHDTSLATPDLDA